RPLLPLHPRGEIRARAGVPIAMIESTNAEPARPLMRIAAAGGRPAVVAGGRPAVVDDAWRAAESLGRTAMIPAPRSDGAGHAGRGRGRTGGDGWGPGPASGC